ncbi:MAG: hypothetical protein V1877_00140 [Candidatus Tagabacteria bacterium]
MKGETEKQEINYGLFGGIILGAMWTLAIISRNIWTRIILISISLFLLCVFKGYFPSFLKFLDYIDHKEYIPKIALIVTIVFLIYFIVKFVILVI